MTWLVTGGAGYIGGHVVAEFAAAGEEVVVLDDLSTGSTARIVGVPFRRADVLDAAAVAAVIRDHRVDGIVHVAGKKRVDQSMSDPLLYYRQNVEGTRALLEAAVAGGVGRFIFSSSAAVYGAASGDAIREDEPLRPVSPYGATKAIGERMLSDVARSTGIAAASLRYFNVAGCARAELADRDGGNLLPLVLDRLDAGFAPVVFGGDYPTRDGSCVRDFVDVGDVASAHLAAARALSAGVAEPLTLNVGRGEGVSVLELVECVLQVLGLDRAEWARPIVVGRRPGDSASVVASVDLIGRRLGWRASRGLRDMVEASCAARRADPGSRRRESAA